MDEFSKLIELKKVAQDRLDHPPKFTKRDVKVKELYEKIINIDLTKVDGQVIQQFESEPDLTAKNKVLNS